MYDAGFKDPVVIKGDDGFYTDDGDYIHESIEDAIQEDIEKQALNIKKTLSKAQR